MPGPDVPAIRIRDEAEVPLTAAHCFTRAAQSLDGRDPDSANAWRQLGEVLFWQNEERARPGGAAWRQGTYDNDDFYAVYDAATGDVLYDGSCTASNDDFAALIALHNTGTVT